MAKKEWNRVIRLSSVETCAPLAGENTQAAHNGSGRNQKLVVEGKCWLRDCTTMFNNVSALYGFSDRSATGSILTSSVGQAAGLVVKKG